MKRIVLFIVIIIILSVGIFFVFMPRNSHVVVNNDKIYVEIADTSEERQKGLMYRESLCESCGMLFVFETEDYHQFWMKNTDLFLDMVFINSEKEVVDLIHASPCLEECEIYTPKEKARYVLETNFMKFDERILGDKVVFG